MTLLSRRITQGDNLRMRGWIVIDLTPIATAAKDLLRWIVNDHAPDRHVPSLGRRLRLRYGELHETVCGQVRSFIRHNFSPGRKAHGEMVNAISRSPENTAPGNDPLPERLVLLTAVVNEIADRRRSRRPQRCHFDQRLRFDHRLWSLYEQSQGVEPRLPSLH
jgi:hypothetical protein